MPNQDIITSLRNAVNHGERLEDAVNVMIHSGYNPQEVQEASRFVRGGTLTMQQPMSDEHLIMPGKVKQPSMPPQYPQFPQQSLQSPQSSQQPQTFPQQFQQSPQTPQSFQSSQPQTPSQFKQPQVYPQSQQSIYPQFQIPSQPNQQMTPQQMIQQQANQQPQPQEPTNFQQQNNTLQSTYSQKVPPIQPPIKKQDFGQSPPLSRQLENLKPRKPSHTKEIILLIILLVLVGLLILTIVLREKIIGWFS